MAADVTLAWDPNAETTLAGYKLHYGTAPRNYTTVIDVRNRTTHTVRGLGPGTYYFAVTAYDILSSESGFSNEVFTTISLPCTHTIHPSSQSFTSAAGTGKVSVTSPTRCDWTATSNADWITITAGTSGSGHGTVEYAVSANTGVSRSGAISIAGQTFTVTQSGSSCNYVISPATQSFTSAAGTGTISVTSPAGCSWTAESNTGWITITAGSSGSGTGTVEYAVSTNTTPDSRSGAISIAGHTFTVTQSGNSCNYMISPATQSFTSAAETGTISVTSPADCSWTAESNAGWITITAGSSGSGTGTVEYAVSANTTSASRSGALSIAGLTFMVFQEGEALAYSAYFAQFANGSQWVSSIILTNPSRTETATGLIQLLDDSGQPFSASINDQPAAETVRFTIQPLGSARFVTDGVGDLVAGSVRVSSNVRLGGTVRYSHPALGVAAVGESTPLSALMTVAVRDENRGLNTGIAVRNTRASDLSLLLFLRDLNGRVVPEGFASVTIPSGGHVAKFIDQFFQAADTSDFQGTLVITSPDSDAAIAATAIQLGRSPGELTTLPVVAMDPSMASSELYFAHFANGSEWTTSIFLTNPSDSVSGSVLSFFDDEGNRLSVPLVSQAAGEGLPRAIQPQGATVISTDGAGSLVSGSARVTGSGPIGGVLRFSSRVLGLAGLGSSVPTAGFIVPVTRSISGRWSSGLAIASTGAPARLSLTLRNQHGEPVSGGQLELLLRANGHTARFLEQLFPNADTGEFLGTLTVTAEGGAIVGTAIQIGSEEGGLTTLPVTLLDVTN